MDIKIVDKNNFENEVIKCEKPVLIDFYATWCGPCKMLSPIIEEMAKEREDIKFCKVNVDEEDELSRIFNISSIPTLQIIKNKKAIERSVGLVTKEEIEKLIIKSLNK